MAKDTPETRSPELVIAVRLEGDPLVLLVVDTAADEARLAEWAAAIDLPQRVAREVQRVIEASLGRTTGLASDDVLPREETG